jgi:hypothetical protein
MKKIIFIALALLIALVAEAGVTSVDTVLIYHDRPNRRQSNATWATVRNANNLSASAGSTDSTSTGILLSYTAANKDSLISIHLYSDTLTSGDTRTRFTVPAGVGVVLDSVAIVGKGVNVVDSCYSVAGCPSLVYCILDAAYTVVGSAAGQTESQLWRSYSSGTLVASDTMAFDSNAVSTSGEFSFRFTIKDAGRLYRIQNRLAGNAPSTNPTGKYGVGFTVLGYNEYYSINPNLSVAGTYLKVDTYWGGNSAVGSEGNYAYSDKSKIWYMIVYSHLTGTGGASRTSGWAGGWVGGWK